MRAGAITRLLSAALLGMVALATTRPTHAMECGDVDANGSIAASDALAVLRKAVGLTVETLQCPDACNVSTTTTTTSTTSNTSEDLCFEDEDCEISVGPGYVCGGLNGYTCVRCKYDSDCEVGFICRGFECVPPTVVGDSCVIDSECAGGDPDKPYCCDFECSECGSSEHCPNGQVCGPSCVCTPFP